MPDQPHTEIQPCTTDACCERVPLVFQLFQLHHLMMRIGDRLTAPLGLTSSRWILLGTIADLDEPPGIGKLSEHAMLSPQAVSRMVTTMEGEGLVERVRANHDARAVLVRLTPAGRAAAERTHQLTERFRGPFLAGCDDARIARIAADLEHLTENLARFERELAEEARPAREGTKP